jgi:hypothetical protein
MASSDPAQQALDEQTRQEERSRNNPKTDAAGRDDGAFMRAAKKLVMPFVRFARKITRKVSLEQSVWIALVLGVVYSMILSYLPGRVLHAMCGNGFVERYVHSNSIFRGLADMIAKFIERHAIVKMLVGAVVAMATLGLLPLVIAYTIMSDPRMIRSFITVMVLPNAFAAFFWHGVIKAIRKKTELTEASSMIVCASFSGLCVGIFYLMMSSFAPNALRWIVGVLSPGMFITAIVATLLFGTVTAIAHVEGHRQSDGSTGGVHADTVHPTSIVLAGVAAVTMLLIMPFVDRRAFARLRALAPT